jgi:hypothetical protein
MEKKVRRLDYFLKSIKWFFGNAIFALAPLLFMYALNVITVNKICHDKVIFLIKDGAVLFVCGAIMGAVFVEYLLSGFELNGTTSVFIYGAPILMLMFILIEYLLIYLKVIDDDYFSLNSLTSKVVIVLSFIYCILVKTDLYIKEDLRHE